MRWFSLALLLGLGPLVACDVDDIDTIGDDDFSSDDDDSSLDGWSDGNDDDDSSSFDL